MSFKVFLPIAVTLLMLSGVDCNHNPAGPSSTDTTSHNFTWTLQTLGGASGSVLYDVAIINDTLTYAVGEMYLNDSTGQIDLQPYNIAIWDGRAWNLQRIPYNYQGQVFYSPIHSVFAFNSDDIWFEAGIHWDGHQFETIPLNIDFPSHVNRMWGNSSNNLYIVGNNGLIAHNINGSWTKIASGTTLQFNDIWGGYNAKTSQWDILAVCSQNYPLGRAIYSIKGNSAAQISTNPIQYELFGVWFAPNQHYYVVGDGIYEKNSITDTAWKNGPTDITRYATTKVRGNNVNDVFVVGAFGEFLHWNGVSWRSYIGQTGLADGSYASVAVQGNIVVAVGANNAQAVITMGRR